MKAVFILCLGFAVVLGAEEEKKEKVEVVGHPFSWPFVGWEEMKPYGGTTKASRTEVDGATRDSFKVISEEGLSKKERDRRAILALAGDYRVSFDFIETASSAESYEPRRPYFSWATERAMVIAEEEDFISLQHILVMEFVGEDGEVQGPFVMKHWRQDWRFEDEVMWEFQGDRAWKKRELRKSKGMWTQAVFQVDDSPRYETVGRWSHEGGMSIFRSRDFWRPLPRREFSVRDDYNVLAGRHEVTVTPTGWLHTQNNRKLLVEDGKVQATLATELGAVRYEQIATPSLAKAEGYWKATEDFWGAVRGTWSSLEAGGDEFALEGKVEGKSMFMHLFGLAGKVEAGELESEVAEVEGMAVIGRFLKSS
ncbi:MAG: DUF6607 family protein [Verrucomicrobiota bacterium]